jgi:hypothetical protein
MELQAQQQFQNAAVQDKIQKTFGNDEKELVNKDHEQSMMDKKIELERIKSKKKPAASTGKKTIKEARNLGLTYIGNNQYANNDGQVTHLAQNGYLVEITK